jgi:hypothetical protein
MFVIATAKGWDNLRMREEGEVFEMPDDAKASWFRPYKGDEEEAKHHTRRRGKQAQGSAENDLG